MTVLLAAAIAYGADPQITVTAADDGSVVGRMHIDATPDAVREMLADPAAACQLSPEVLSAVAGAKDGHCQILQVSTQGLWNPLKYSAKVCPTPDGFTTELVDSDSFTALSTQWTITEANGGADVEYRVKSHISSIPDPLVRKGTERSMTATLLALVKQVVK